MWYTDTQYYIIIHNIIIICQLAIYNIEYTYGLNVLVEILQYTIYVLLRSHVGIQRL